MPRDNLLLASSSPRRREILARAGFRFSVVKADVDETLPKGRRAIVAAAMIALQKAEAGLANRRASRLGSGLAEEATAKPRPARSARRADVVLSADTIVVLGSHVLGKPENDSDARRMLRALSGRTHSVITGFAILRSDGGEGFVSAVETAVRFKKLSASEIVEYVATGEPRDKAGAYGIQGIGAFLVREISGSFTNVVGLPLVEVIEALAQVSDLRPFDRKPKS